MASMILAEVTANVADLQPNPTATVATGHGMPVAIPMVSRCSTVYPQQLMTACSIAWKTSS